MSGVVHLKLVYETHGSTSNIGYLPGVSTQTRDKVFGLNIFYSEERDSAWHNRDNDLFR